MTEHRTDEIALMYDLMVRTTDGLRLMRQALSLYIKVGLCKINDNLILQFFYFRNMVA
jgi:hypothetical protein